MKKKILILIFLILIIFIGIVCWKYEKYKNGLYEQQPFFDLFIAKSLHKENTNLPFGNFWDNSWDRVSKEEQRPIKWLIYKNEFEKLDSVYLGFKNTTREKFYYVTWGEPNSRIRISFKVFRNGKIDSIPFEGFGCGTGIFITPLKKGEIASSKLLNPLLFNPYSNYTLPVKNKKFPKLFREIYGDSVAIKFEQATYSLPWSKYPSQMIASEEIIVSTDKFIQNWKQNLFNLNSEFRKENKNSYYLKENGKFKLSTTFEEKKNLK